jgi:hypothetical protein
MKIIINLGREILLLLGSVRESIMKPSETSGKKCSSLSSYEGAHYYMENGLIMSDIIKLFLVTFSFCYIGNISRLTSSVKVRVKL